MFTVLRQMAIAVAGVLIGHQIAHGLAPEHVHDASHGYVGLALAAVLPLAVGSLWSLGRDTIRDRVDHIRPAELLAAQMVLFVGQESLERVGAGGSMIALAADPTLWMGLAAQGLVVGSLVLVMRTASKWFVPCARSEGSIRLLNCFGTPIHRADWVIVTAPLRTVAAGRAPPARVSLHPR